MSLDPQFPPPLPTPPVRAPLPVQGAPILPPGYAAPGQYGAPAWQVGAAHRYVANPGARPGIVTAIGVISIIVASLTLLGSFLSGAWGVSILRIARTTATMSPRGPTLTLTTPAPQSTKHVVTSVGPNDAWSGRRTPLVPGPRGFGAADRKTIIDAWETLEDLPAPRRRQIEAILAKSGQDILPLDGRAADFDTVRSAVRDHGTLPNADPDQAAPIYFDLPAGQLQVYDDRAVFRPSAPGAPILRAAAPADAPEPLSPEPPALPAPPAVVSPRGPARPPGPVDPFADDDVPSAPPVAASGAPAAPAAAAVYPSGLTPAQVQSIVQKAQNASGNKLNAAQLKAIHTALEAQGQQLVTPATMWSPIAMAVTQPDGSAVVKFSNSYLFMDAQGQVMQQGSTRLPKVSVNPLSVALVLSEAIVSSALAILLLAAGVLVLRQSPKGRLLHLLYALLKIPLAIGGAVGLVWLTDQFVEGVRAANPGAGSGGSGMQTFGIIMALLAIIYPIALLITMSTRSVRAYYASLRNDRTFR